MKIYQVWSPTNLKEKGVWIFQDEESWERFCAREGWNNAPEELWGGWDFAAYDQNRMLWVGIIHPIPTI